MKEQELSEPQKSTLLQQIMARLKRPVFIGIAGDSGSGKTTFSDGIRRMLGDDVVQTIEMDGYHKENRKQRKKSGRLPLDPEANHLELLHTHLLQLRLGKSVHVPDYNHATGDFDKPLHVKPTPVIIVEGLHALYPQFLPFLDFTIYADPAREIKWKWKFERDMKKRGHKAEKLKEEMLEREAAYKRWIDFQKTSANISIKIFHSQLASLARKELKGILPHESYKFELLMTPSPKQLLSLQLPFDLSSFFDLKHPPFMLAAVPCIYWGRELVNVHVDGTFSAKTIATLEERIGSITGVSARAALTNGDMLGLGPENNITATQFTQLIIVWGFLEQISERLKTEQSAKSKEYPARRAKA